MPSFLLLRRPLPLATCLASLLMLTACGDAPEPPTPAPAEVAVVTLQARPLALTRELPGRVHPSKVAEVRPQVGGIVAALLFEEGAQVDAGSALYQLDDASYRADVASARAALARAEATLESARLAAARSERLARIDAVSAQDNEAAIAAQRQAEADVGVARAALQQASILQGYARITAPIGGRIGKSTVTQGALVTANQTQALATVQQLDPVHVELTQSSSEWLELRREFAEGTLTRTPDVPVTLRLEDGSLHAQPGQLAFSEVSVDPQTGSYLLRVVVPNPDGLLLPGMYVRAQVSSGERSEGLLVPQEGVTRDPKGRAVAMVVAADGSVEQRVIEVSRSLGNQWIVDAGLAAGERVVVEGLQKIRPGAKVSAVERTAAPADAAAVVPPADAPASGEG